MEPTQRSRAPVPQTEWRLASSSRSKTRPNRVLDRIRSPYNSRRDIRSQECSRAATFRSTDNLPPSRCESRGSLKVQRSLARKLLAPTSREQARLPDLDLRPRAVFVILRRAADRVDDFHPAHDAAEHGMLPIQPEVVDDVDEELAPASVRTRVRHRDRAPPVAVIWRELVFDRVPRTSHPRALGGSALNHEVRNHAMEDCSIVEALPDELAEVARRDRHRLVEQLDLHIAHRRLAKDGRHAGGIRSAYVKDVARSHLTR